MTRDDLDHIEAYHEGRLDAVRAATWAARLAGNPDLRGEVAAELRLANGLRALAGDGPRHAALSARRTLALIHAGVPARETHPTSAGRSGRRSPFWHRPWFWGTAAGFAAAASLAVLLLLPAMAHPTQGDSVILAWTGDRPLVQGEGIEGGNLRFADGSTVALAPGGSLRLAGDARRKRVELTRGILSASIHPQGQGEGFVVTLPQGEATVIGTRFRIEAGTAASLLRVDEGRVALRSGVETADIGVGEAAIAAEGRVLTLPPPWSDRRPIGRWVLSGSGQAGNLSVANPNGWLHDPTLAADIDLPARLERETTRITALLRRIDAQGVILYGIEGAAAQIDAGFVGDPRRLPDLAPEMDAQTDTLFATLRRYGLAVGVSITPWRLVMRDGRLMQEADPATASAELEAKVAYARRRWDCRLFYINVASPGQEPGNRLPDFAVQMLASRHPEVLFIVEDATPGQALAAAPQMLGTNPAPPGRVCVRLPWNGPGAGAEALATARTARDIVSVDVLAGDQLAELGHP